MVLPIAMLMLVRFLTVMLSVQSGKSGSAGHPGPVDAGGGAGWLATGGRTWAWGGGGWLATGTASPERLSESTTINTRSSTTAAMMIFLRASAARSSQHMGSGATNTSSAAAASADEGQPDWEAAPQSTRTFSSGGSAGEGGRIRTTGCSHRTGRPSHRRPRPKARAALPAPASR